MGFFFINCFSFPWAVANEGGNSNGGLSLAGIWVGRDIFGDRFDPCLCFGQMLFFCLFLGCRGATIIWFGFWLFCY
ncbi:hypothetical protein QBC44DRAFT_328395 [Cladorrhinum sp. PSN332]|nr:hypothetical protein QBC44DRAFT_328395 [Cladorrhinum sp. PSN332]